MWRDVTTPYVSLAEPAPSLKDEGTGYARLSLRRLKYKENTGTLSQLRTCSAGISNVLLISLSLSPFPCLQSLDLP